VMSCTVTRAIDRFLSGRWHVKIWRKMYIAAPDTVPARNPEEPHSASAGTAAPGNSGTEKQIRRTARGLPANVMVQQTNTVWNWNRSEYIYIIMVQCILPLVKRRQGFQPSPRFTHFPSHGADAWKKKSSPSRTDAKVF
jgi:hypothetical protein